MCGIVAAVGDKNVVTALFSGLKTLEYRGYDSCGIATIDQNGFKLLKGVGAIDDVDAKLNFSSLSGNVGVAHTRWATHGGITRANAHPLLSNDNGFAIVHNGIISNYEELKSMLIKNEFIFHSETDSEVIANLLQFHFNKHNSVDEAVKKTQNMLKGCYAIAIATIYQPDVIYGMKHLLPLVIGTSNNTKYLCSDVLGFAEFTDQAVTIEDKEYVLLSVDGYQIFSASDYSKITRKPFKIKQQSMASSKGNFDHYMLKEIFDQPQAMSLALDIEQKHINNLAAKIAEADHTYVVGIGTTYYIAKAACYMLDEIADSFANAVPADEFSAVANPNKKTISIFISQSGETYDTKEALTKAKEANLFTAAIVNAPNSTIARSVDQVIYQNSGVEVSVVSTKAALAQLTVLYRIAWQVAYLKKLVSKKQLDDFFQRFRRFIVQLEGILNSTSQNCAQIAGIWARYDHLLCLGKGFYYPLALETALKIKEVAYIHAEGMPTGFLKHGTLALIDEKIPCLFFMPPKSEQHLVESTLAAIEEIKARHGITIGFREADDDKLASKFSQSFIIPEIDNSFYPLYQLIVMQLFSYHLAKHRGREIDKPRNLAKSVTVP